MSRVVARWVAGVTGVVLALTLVGTFASTWLSTRVEQAAVASNPVQLKSPEGELQSDLRQFPLHSADGPLTVDFMASEPSKELIEDKIRGVLRGLGLSYQVLALAVDETPIKMQYPYQYPLIDAWVTDNLDPQLVNEHPGEMLDLTALFTMAATDTMGTLAPSENFAMVAYSIAKRVMELAPTCEMQLQVTFITSLGLGTRIAWIEEEAMRGRQACPGDPTPTWIAGATKWRMALWGWAEEDAVALREAAETDFERLMADHPTSPVGFVAMADLLLDRALISENRGLRPFQVRQWRREALALAEQARGLSSDPAVAMTHQRALTSLGRFAEAQRVWEGMPADARGIADVQAAHLEQAIRSRDVDAFSREVTAADLQLRDSAYLTPGAVAQGFGSFDSHASQVRDASYDAQGGSDIDDLTFLPEYRRDWSVRATLPEQLPAVVDVLRNPTAPLAEEANELWGPQPVASYEARQDLFRWFRDFDGAKAVVDAWRQAEPESFVALQRSGEVAYLQGRLTDARGYLEAATEAANRNVDVVNSQYSNDAVQPREALLLQRAAVLAELGDTAAAKTLLTTLLDNCEAWSPNDPAVFCKFYALSQLGQLSLRSQDFTDASEHLSSAVAMAHSELETSAVGWSIEHDPVVVLLRGAQENNWALATARSGEPAFAVPAAQAALARYPYNPVFLDTVAFTQHLTGDAGAAAAAYRQALDADPTSYVSANNLAVILAEQGDEGGARTLLEQSLSYAPEYSTARHNLGVLGARSLTVGSLFGQADLALAARTDGALRGEAASLIVDENVYASGLDISKALAPDWSYSRTATNPMRGFLPLMIVLLGMRLAWSMVLDKVVENFTLRAHSRRVPFAAQKWFRIPAWLALAVSVGVLGWSAWGSTASAFEGVVWVVVLASLVLLPYAVRRLQWKANPTPMPMRGSLPAAIIAAGAAAFGVTFTPVPGADETRVKATPKGFWLPMKVVAGITLAFAVVTLVSGSPLARAVTVASAALLAAMLLPIHPFDGARLKNRWAGLASTVGLTGLTVALVAQWI